MFLALILPSCGIFSQTEITVPDVTEVDIALPPANIMARCGEKVDKHSVGPSSEDQINAWNMDRNALDDCRWKHGVLVRFARETVAAFNQGD